MFQRLEFRRRHEDICPGEEKCAKTKGRPIFAAIAQRSRPGQMKEAIANVSRELILDCCKHCPLEASKPGKEKVGQHVLAAAESASRLKQMIDSNVAQLVYKPGEISARRCAALMAMSQAENRSTAEGFKEAKKKSNKK